MRGIKILVCQPTGLIVDEFDTVEQAARCVAKMIAHGIMALERDQTEQREAVRRQPSPPLYPA
jgi:hypothetical protein